MNVVCFLFVFISTLLPFNGNAITYSEKGDSYGVALNADIKTSLVYYVDGNGGSDANNGTSEVTALKSIAKVQQLKLVPGDVVKFKRGTSYIGPLYINDSGTQANYILLTDYGNKELPAPKFTNPVFKEGNFGNCIRLKGSFIKVENFYFHQTPVYKPGKNYEGGFLTMWEMGAIYIDKEAENCVISNNEVFDCPVGIKTYGKNTLIEHNYIHDCNRVLKEWNWGPIGIWISGDYQEARFNRIFNYRAENPKIGWSDGGGGADGSAFEIDDARFNKSNIKLHHNYTRDCQGFLEVTWTDVKKHPLYTDFKIHHNISDDYQQFVALWVGANFNIDHNTIIRRKKNSNDWGVFNIVQDDSRNKIRNNIVITEKDIPIFNVGLNGDHRPNSIIKNNLYYAASGKLIMGKEGPGLSPIYGDPLFQNYKTATKSKDFSLKPNSPAIDKATKLGYQSDYLGVSISVDNLSDIGAFEINNNQSTKEK